jgi:hypothetical protein
LAGSSSCGSSRATWVAVEDDFRHSLVQLGDACIGVDDDGGAGLERGQFGPSRVLPAPRETGHGEWGAILAADQVGLLARTVSLSLSDTPCRYEAASVVEGASGGRAPTDGLGAGIDHTLAAVDTLGPLPDQDQ